MKFRDWLKENDIVAKFSELLYEAARDPNEIVNSRKALEKNRADYETLVKLFGYKGRIPTYQEANFDFAANHFMGVFWQKLSEVDKLQVSSKQIEYFEKTAKAKHINYEILNDGVKVFLDDQKFIIFRLTGNSVGKTSDTGEIISSNILVPETAYQESMTAAILQIMAEKKKLKSPEISEELANFIGEKNLKKISPLFKWIITSDPVAQTGICSYVDFKTDNALALQKELFTFLKGAWIKSFEALYSSNVLDEIAKVFKNGVTNWKAARFIHFCGMQNGKSLRNTVVRDYLSNGRCGEVKDVIDKSDIFLCFNMQKAIATINQLMSISDPNEYFATMNDAINNKDFIGISLKQIDGSVHISVANIKTATTATGSNISDEKKIQFKYEGKNNKKNTLNIAGAKINNTNLLDSAGKPKKTFEIVIPMYNGKHIHMSNDTKIVLSVRSNSSKFGSITIEPQIQGLPAQMGKLVKIFDYNFNYNITKELADKLKIVKEPIDVAKKYLECANEVLSLIQNDEETFYKIIAAGVGYPLQLEDELQIYSAPYIKIY